MARKTNKKYNCLGCGVVDSVGNDLHLANQSPMVTFKENDMNFDLQSKQYTKHIKYDDLQLVITYHRLYADMWTIDKIETLDGQNIINIVRDRVIERMEKML